MSSEESGVKKETEIGLLLHAIIFGYQKAVDSVLGAGAAVLVPHAVDGIIRLYEKGGFELAISENIEETIAHFNKKVKELGFAEEVVFKEEEKGKFLFEVKQCAYVDPTHALISPKIAICPIAFLAAAILQKATNKQAVISFSEFIKGGTKTYITLK